MPYKRQDSIKFANDPPHTNLTLRLSLLTPAPGCALSQGPCCETVHCNVNCKCYMNKEFVKMNVMLETIWYSYKVADKEGHD